MTPEERQSRGKTYPGCGRSRRRGNPATPGGVDLCGTRASLSDSITGLLCQQIVQRTGEDWTSTLRLSEKPNGTNFGSYDYRSDIGSWVEA
jgi:hypothetical protein